MKFRLPELYMRIFSFIVFSLVIVSYADHYDFTLYGAGFDYPTNWTIKTNTNSSVTLNIGTNRQLYMEMLPDGMPSEYIFGKLKIMDSLFYNMNSWEKGTIDVGGHWGYYISTTQAEKSTFEMFHMRSSYIRLPKLKRVLVIQYTNFNSNALSWDDDLTKISIIASTFKIENDIIPNRLLLANKTTSPREWLEVKYPSNIVGTPDSSSALKCDAVNLMDIYDQNFLKIRFELQELNLNVKNIDTLLSAIRNTTIALDTLSYGTDTFSILYDSISNGFNISVCTYGNIGFPMLTMLYMERKDNYIYKYYYKGYLADLEHMDYIGNMIDSSAKVIISTQKINYTKRPAKYINQQKNQNEIVLNLLGKKINNSRVKISQLSNGCYILTPNYKNKNFNRFINVK